MKFTVAAVISAVAASAYAQVATGPTAGVAFAHPAYSVSKIYFCKQQQKCLIVKNFFFNRTLFLPVTLSTFLGKRKNDNNWRIYELNNICYFFRYPVAGAVDASKNINSIALMSGGSAALDTVIPNILSGPIPTSPSWYMWNIPLDIATLPSCKSIIRQQQQQKKTYD